MTGRHVPDAAGGSRDVRADPLRLRERHPVRSAVERLPWPPLPTGRAARLLAVLRQLEQSQWWPPERLHAASLRQARVLLRHAVATCPWYRERRERYAPFLDSPADPEAWRRLPVLRRADVLADPERFRSEHLPRGHGPRSTQTTSGSTSGTPFEVEHTDLSATLMLAAAIREHLWQRRDLRGRLGVIARRARTERLAGWDETTHEIFAAGDAVTIHVDEPLDRKIDLLERTPPDCLVTRATAVHALARECLARGRRIDIGEVRVVGERPRPDLGELVRRAFGARLVDGYSAYECGAIAAQCREHARLHLQPESVLYEVLDEAGGATPAGLAGTAVVTPLHNFAMPLVRYTLDDQVVPGAPCGCGRGLPVIDTVLGRPRNRLVDADGVARFPAVHGRYFDASPAIHEIGLRERERGRVRVEHASSRDLEPVEAERLAAAARTEVGSRVALEIARVDEVERFGAYLKSEDFVSDFPEPVLPRAPR